MTRLPRTVHQTPIPGTPAVTFVGRKNSGKTTLVCALIAELTSRGVDVASCKHHGHPDLQVDQPGRDSFRHHEAGARTSAVFNDERFGMVRELDGAFGLSDALGYLQGHDVIIVEGYRRGGLPTIELLRAGNPRDEEVRATFKAALAGEGSPTWEQLPEAVVTDMPDVAQAAKAANVPCFGFDEVAALASFVEERHVRPHLTICIQAGGESKRMGRSKALVPFLGRPMIQTLAERLAPLADELLVTTNEPDELAFLLDEFPQIRFASDTHDERGSVPGMITAFEHATCPLVALVACDMVAASPELIAAETALMASGQTDAVVPVTKHGYEPFAGVYRREAALAAALRTHAAGRKRMADVIDALACHKLEKGNEQGIVFPLGCFMNVNTPEELAFAERLLGNTY